MSTRIYVVAPVVTTAAKSDDTRHAPRLVRASSRAQALSHVARTSYDVHVAGQNDLVRLLPETKVEDAMDEVVDV